MTDKEVVQICDDPYWDNCKEPAVMEFRGWNEADNKPSDPRALCGECFTALAEQATLPVVPGNDDTGPESWGWFPIGICPYTSCIHWYGERDIDCSDRTSDFDTCPHKREVD